MNIQLSDHFDYRRLLVFTLPSIVMMVFTSIYGVVDGFFISNFVGVSEFAAVNLIMPLTQMLGCIGFMLGSGGSALVSKTLGERAQEKANRIFSLLTYLGAAIGVILAVVGCVWIEPIALLMGADESMLPDCVLYGRLVLLALPAFMLQNMFQSFLITAEKPKLGLAVTVAAGVTNISLDALFIIVFDWGVAGAAIATALAQYVGGLLPLFYFARKNSSLLRLGKTKYDGRSVLATCTNGSSELVTNISMSLVSILYNFQLMEIAGEDGVAAYGAVMYVSFIFVAIFLGYSIGVAPLVGYHFGANNSAELKNLLRKSLLFVIVGSLVLAAVAYLLATPLASFFLGADAVANHPALIDMTADAFRYYSVAVLFCGFSIFGSAFFTALSNGLISAAISFSRTLIFQIAAVLILPVFFGIDGIWYSLFVAEFLAMLVTFVFFATMRKKYKYF